MTAALLQWPTTTTPQASSSMQPFEVTVTLTGSEFFAVMAILSNVHEEATKGRADALSETCDAVGRKLVRAAESGVPR